MLLLSLSCARVHEVVPRTADEFLMGRLSAGVARGMGQMEDLQKPRGVDLDRQMAAGHLVGRALLEMGREAEAEELFQHQLKIYESVSRPMVRWHAALDHGSLSLALNRGGRAAEAFSTVADDQAAPPPLRIEALAGLASALERYREDETVSQVLAAAARLAEAHGLAAMAEAVQALRLQARARCWVRDFAEAADGSTISSQQAALLNAAVPLREELSRAAGAAGDNSLIRRRLTFLHALLDAGVPTPRGVGMVMDHLRSLREDRAVETETLARIEAGKVLLAHGDAKSAREALGSLVFDERTACRHRFSMDLRFCLSRMCALDGRLSDALRLYGDYARQAVQHYGADRPRGPVPRVVEELGREQEADAAKLRLPLRYRRAYQYIMEHLHDANLSVRQVAAQIDVTERALQMAFRGHLGMTPAELIRERRMSGIRQDLVQSRQRDSVVEVASRWGVRNRSTLAHGYRRQFNETPSGTLRG